MVETLTVSGGAAVPTPVPRYRYQLDNHLGTACVEADQAGAVISYEEYHPYGTSAYRSFQSAEVSAKRYRYTGKERDEETKLYYHGARYYAPWLGRWTQADPAGTVDGTNLYAYVRGSPVGLKDPNGTQANIEQLGMYGVGFEGTAIAEPAGKPITVPPVQIEAAPPPPEPAQMFELPPEIETKISGPGGLTPELAEPFQLPPEVQKQLGAALEVGPAPVAPQVSSRLPPLWKIVANVAAQSAAAPVALLLSIAGPTATPAGPLRLFEYAPAQRALGSKAEEDIQLVLAMLAAARAVGAAALASPAAAAGRVAPAATKLAERGEASILAQASGAAFKAAEHSEQFTVGAKHIAGAGGRWAKFTSSVDPNATLREALSSPNARFLPNDTGSFRVVTDLGRVIGTRGETGVRAVVSFEGHVITWFPVRP